MAVVHPEPEPTSSTRCPGRASRSVSISRTVVGWEHVAPCPIVSGWSASAKRCWCSGRKTLRSVAATASCTRRAASECSTIPPSRRADVSPAVSLPPLSSDHPALLCQPNRAPSTWHRGRGGRSAKPSTPSGHREHRLRGIALAHREVVLHHPVVGEQLAAVRGEVLLAHGSALCVEHDP